MFCPNCGTGNDDGATKCHQCGFTLKPSERPKFKGTMMMMNAPAEAQEALRKAGVQVPGGGGDAPQAGGTQPSLGQSDEAGAVPEGSAPAPGAPEQAKPAVKPKLKGTMIGVAPPSLGMQLDSPSTTAKQPSVAPTGGGVAATVLQPAVPGAGDAPSSSGTAATVPQPAVPQPAGSQQPAPQPGHVNPLGGTMVASAEQFQAPAAAPAPAAARAGAVTAQPLSGSEILLVIVTCGIYGLVRALKHQA